MGKHAWIAIAMVATALAGCAGDVEDPVIDPVQEHLKDPVPVGSVPYNLTGPYSRVLEPGPLAIQPPVRVDLVSELDGERIEMALWMPEGNGTFPVMLFSSPYFHAADRLRVEVPEMGTIGSSRTVDRPGGAVQNLIEQLVPHGYAFATHAVRGTAGSDGCNDLMGPKEISDIDQAVTWLGTQDWSNGNVAMTGVSYDGSTPWSAASTGNPHLKTIIPISGVPDLHGLMYRNGSSETRGPLVLNALYYEIGIESGPLTPQAYGQRILCPEAWTGVAMSGVAGVHGSDPSGYWQERDRKPAVLANYKGSVFSVQGLQDWNVDPSQVVPWVDELERAGIKTKQLLGQWGHAWPDSIGTEESDNREQRLQAYRADYNEILLRWLESELKGKDIGTGPAVQVRDDLGRWRSEQHYPPRDTNWTTYAISSDGRLKTGGATSGDAILTPNAPFSLPGDLEMPGGPSVADFTLGPVPKDTLIVGLPKVHVSVTPHGPGGYMAAYLYEREQNGELDALGWTTMNLAYADGGTEYTPVVPGVPITARLEIQPMDSVVEEGNTLVLRLWVFTDRDRLPTIPPNGVTLHMGAESVLKLPTVERGPEYYFTPPNLDKEDQAS